jgi:sugar lactone lactonase YvrE
MPRPRLLPVDAVGPEDVAVEADGSVLTGVEGGLVLRLRPGAPRPDLVVDTGGRPLGIEAAADGRIVVCDAERGLLRVDPDGTGLEVLVPADGDRLALCNNAAVAPDGTVYFSDSSHRFPLRYWMADVLEHRASGRLLRRTPDGAVDVLLDGLCFANGVALAADGTFVAVAETSAYRLRRVWLTGPRAGRDDVLVDNLPGMPDNLSTGRDGRVWIALPSPRNAALDWALPRAPGLRRALWALPPALHPTPPPTAWVMAVDPLGRTVADLQRRVPGFRMATGVRETGDGLVLGTLTGGAVARVALPGDGAAAGA